VQVASKFSPPWARPVSCSRVVVPSSLQRPNAGVQDCAFSSVTPALNAGVQDGVFNRISTPGLQCLRFTAHCNDQNGSLSLL
jgi:hypothetical protein